MARQLPSLPAYRTDAVTRRLCASVHLDDGFARAVSQEFTGDGMRALGLTLGVNLIALVRHAQAAVHRRNALDARLAGLFGAALAALALAVSGLATGGTWLVLGGLGGVLAVLVGAWWLIHRTESAARDAAQAVYRSNTPAADLAPPVDPQAEARLGELRKANIVPYAAEAAKTNPFVGSGRRIKEAVWQPIDVSRPADSPSGGKLVIRPFDAVDLHTYVAREMANIAGLEGLRARNRLYVLGTNVPYLGPDVLPDRHGRPLARIPNQLVQAGVEQAGAGMRTYLGLERVSDGGRTIVSMYLRARLQYPSLTWEVAAYTIPPLHGYYNKVDYLPVGRVERWWDLVKHATSHLWPELRGAVGRLISRSSQRSRQARELEKSRREISKKHVLFDYGALDSLRERVSSWDEMGHAERTDAQDYLHRLQQGVLIATERFLKDHNVDTSSFDQAQQVINQQTYNFHGDINGPGNYGNNGQINPGPGGPPQP